MIQNNYGIFESTVTAIKKIDGEMLDSASVSQLGTLLDHIVECCSKLSFLAGEILSREMNDDSKISNI